MADVRSTLRGCRFKATCELRRHRRHLAGLHRGLEAGEEGQPANLGPSRTEGASAGYVSVAASGALWMILVAEDEK